MESHLVIHHIGARGETQAFPALPAFDEDVVNILVDADKSSEHETQVSNSHRKARIVTEPACIGGTSGKRTFRHTQGPYASSLLAIDPAVGGLYVAPRWIDYDYTIKDALETARTELIETITIDEMVSRSEGRVPLPDFLSLDTQGNELEILEGAPDSLSNALGVVSEVEFVSLYEGQPLVGDILKFMQSNGFLFCGFFEILNGSYFRAPVGLRGKTCPITTDALFLRSPDRLTDKSPGRLKKLAFFALINGHIEIALWALSYLTHATADVEPPAWTRFVDEFKIVADGFPRLIPEDFKQQKLSPLPADVRTRFAIRARSDVGRLMTQSKLLSDLLVKYGLDKVAALQMEQTNWTVTHFALQNDSQ